MSALASAGPFSTQQALLFVAVESIRSKFGMTDTTYVPYVTDTMQVLLYKLVGSISTLPSNGGSANYSGAGSPEGVQTATVGSVYTDLTNSKVYIKTSGTGNTGWTLYLSL